MRVSARLRSALSRATSASACVSRARSSPWRRSSRCCALMALRSARRSPRSNSRCAWARSFQRAFNVASARRSSSSSREASSSIRVSPSATDCPLSTRRETTRACVSAITVALWNARTSPDARSIESSGALRITTVRTRCCVVIGAGSAGATAPSAAEFSQPGRVPSARAASSDNGRARWIVIMSVPLRGREDLGRSRQGCARRAVRGTCRRVRCRAGLPARIQSGTETPSD